MAKFEISTNELATLAESFSDGLGNNFKGHNDGITFDAEYEHGIPLVPTSIPLLVTFDTMINNNLYFDLQLNSGNILIKKSFPLLLKGLSKLISNDTFPNGISLEGGKIKVAPDTLLDEYAISLKKNSVEMKNGKLVANFSFMEQQNDR